MGYFIGIELSAENKAHVLASQESLKNDFPEVTWLSEEQLFCVLCYLPVHNLIVQNGEPKSGLTKQSAEKLLETIGENVAPISITLATPGAFPLAGPARVSWIGIKDLEPQRGMLVRLIRETTKLLAQGALTPAELIPHIPIGRASDRAPKKDLRKRSAAIAVDGTPQQVGRIVLVESTQGHHGPKYQIVKSAELSAQFWG